jgi:hypothetical protein
MVDIEMLSAAMELECLSNEREALMAKARETQKLVHLGLGAGLSDEEITLLEKAADAYEREMMTLFEKTAKLKERLMNIKKTLSKQFS